MSKKNGCNLNDLIIIGNIIVCAAAIYLYFMNGGNQYVNIYTLILLCLFGAENTIMLLYEKKKNDPFVIILLLVTLGFYMVRVVTLLYVPSSPLSGMDSVTPADQNYSLIFIMVSNIAIFLGLSAAGAMIPYRENGTAGQSPANPYTVIILLLSAIGISFWLPVLGEITGRFLGYISIFANLYLIVLFTVVYLVVNFIKLSNRIRILLLGLFTIFVLKATLSGSRAGLLTLTFYLLFAILSVKGKIRFNNRMIVMSLILIPVSLYFFIVATYMSQIDAKRLLPYNEKLSILTKTSSLGNEKEIKEQFRPIFERAGFLDYPTILIKDRERYGKIINFQYYFGSIVDNVLTPGFNVFGIPRVAHSMSYIARGEPVPTLEQIYTAYQSDMPTVYGEYYVLFYGYFAVIVLFMFSFIFKKVYVSIRSKDIFLFYLYRALVLYIFYIWLNSFGIDWMLLDLIGIVITIVLFNRFYKMTDQKNRDSLRTVLGIEK